MPKRKTGICTPDVLRRKRRQRQQMNAGPSSTKILGTPRKPNNPLKDYQQLQSESPNDQVIQDVKMNEKVVTDIEMNKEIVIEDDINKFNDLTDGIRYRCNLSSKRIMHLKNNDDTYFGGEEIYAFLAFLTEQYENLLIVDPMCFSFSSLRECHQEYYYWRL